MIDFIKGKYKMILVAVVILVALIGTYLAFAGKASKVSASYMEIPVTRRDIKVSISGSGTLNSSYRQQLSAIDAGTVKKVYFKEGDKVKAGDVIFELDDSSVLSQIEKTRLNIRQAQMDLDSSKNDALNLTVHSPISGQVKGLRISEGDTVSKGMEICTVEDSSTLKVSVPFNGKQIESFYVGQEATLYVQDYMCTLNGRISYINSSGKLDQRGARVYDVEITADNSTANISPGVTATAQIGGFPSISASIMEYGNTKKVMAQVSGTVKSLNIRDNEYVSAGQQIMQLENDTLERQIISSELKVKELNTQLEQLLKDLELYKGTAVIGGTIVKQDIMEGDNIKAGEVLSTIADHEKMEFVLDVDELDIANVKVGMEASITVGAFPDKVFKGTVVKVANEGTSQNGVTTYPVTVVVSNPEQLLGGMNVNAEIIIQQKQNVLTVPVSAVQKVRNQNFVLVPKKSGSQNETSQQRPGNARRADGNPVNPAQRTERPSRPSGVRTYGSDIEMKQVQVGIADETNIEIIEGLNEGDIVLVASQASTNGSSGGPRFMGGMGEMGGAVRIQQGGMVRMRQGGPRRDR